MAGRHAKRTTVKPHWMSGRDELGWRIDYATFDRPTNPYVVAGPGARLRALDEAHAFEQAKARARFIERNRVKPSLDEPLADVG